jgi:hypothetical protein
MNVIFFCYGFDYNQYRIYWMSYAADLERVPESLSRRAQKLRITVKVYRENDVPANIVRSDLRDLVKILRANPQWCSLDIRLEREELDEEILRPFGILRRLRHVDVTGVSPQFAAELSELMKSDSPVTDLPKIYYHLTRHINAVLSQVAKTSILTTFCSRLNRPWMLATPPTSTSTETRCCGRWRRLQGRTTNGFFDTTRIR